jgi:hypothetical protein
MKVSNLNDTSDSYPGTGVAVSPQSVARGVSRMEAREAELGLFKQRPCLFLCSPPGETETGRASRLSEKRPSRQQRTAHRR